MRLTIIPSDGAVYEDGICYSNLTWEETPDGVHALQWFDVEGWIEFNDPNPLDTYKPPNQTITELPNWALNAMAAWEAANNQAAAPNELLV